MWNSIQMKWWSLKRAMMKTKWTISRFARVRILHMKLQVIRLNRRRRKAKRRAMRGLKDAVLPSMPGVSKLKLPEPPASRLIHSNSLPTDEEIALVRAAISKAEDEKEHMRRRLILKTMSGNGGQPWETATRHKIGRATRFIRQHQGIVSPLRRLPPELLEEIFLWTITFRIHSRWQTDQDLPWALGQVCQSWRRSALAVSALWSHIPTISLKKSRKKTAYQLSALKEMLKRSRGSPLRFYVYARSYAIYTHPIIDLLVLHCERWESATFEVSRNLLSCLKPIKDRLHCLETLSLQVRFGERDTVIDMFEVAPRLRDVYISGMWQTGELPMPLPYSQLVSYKERLLSRDLINRVIVSPATSLEHLTILELADGPALPPVTLPHLVKLTVKFYCGMETPFLSSLTLPVIEDVRVVLYLGSPLGGSLLTSLISMFSNSNPCHLKDLSYRTESEEPGTFARLLHLLPNLINLDATIPDPPDLQHLSTGYEERPIVPRLETCKFYSESAGLKPKVAEALNTLADARCEAISDIGDSDILIPGEIRPLKSLSIYYDNSDATHGVQASLHSWKTSVPLNLFKIQLEQELPELGHGRKPLSRKLDLKWSNRVLAVFDAIEDFHVEHVNDIYNSELHLSLKRLSDWKIPSHEAFTERAKDILAKWDPLFRKHLNELRWTCRGRYCIDYVPQNDPVRISATPLDVIYGLHDSTMFKTIFWPMYMGF